MIQLTAEEAAYVSGPSPSNPHSVLEPEPMHDGNYMLPESAIFDPSNADVRSYLESHIVPGDPSDEQTWNFANEEDHTLHDSLELKTYESQRGTAARAAEVGVEHREEPDVDEEPAIFDDDADNDDKPTAKKAKKRK